jgi:hypothetical protein
MRQGLDEACRRGIVSQGLAEFTNRTAQNALADHRPGPGRGAQLLTSDQPSRVFHQSAKDGKELGTERDEILSAPQLLAAGVEPERGKNELMILHSGSGIALDSTCTVT